jgi:hypothetical protein
MQRNGKLGSDCVERVELLMKKSGVLEKCLNEQELKDHKVEGGARPIWKANRLGQHLRWWMPHVIPKIEMSDWQATLAAYLLARICSVLFDNREKGMLVKLATLSTQVRAGIQGTISDEVIREKRPMFRSQTISRSHKLCEVDLLLVQCLICLAVWRLEKTVAEIRCKGRAKTRLKVT